MLKPLLIVIGLTAEVRGKHYKVKLNTNNEFWRVRKNSPDVSNLFSCSQHTNDFFNGVICLLNICEYVPCRYFISSTIWKNFFCFIFFWQTRFTRLSRMLHHLLHIKCKFSDIKAVFYSLLQHLGGTSWRFHSRNCTSCRYSYTVDAGNLMQHSIFLTFGIKVTLSTAPAAAAFLPIAPFSLLRAGCLKAAISWSHWHPGALRLFSSPHFCIPELPL